MRIHKHNNKNTQFTKLNKNIQTYNHTYNDKKVEPKKHNNTERKQTL